MSDLQINLISLSEHSDDYCIPDKQAPWNEDIDYSSDDNYEIENGIYEDEQGVEIAFIQRKMEENNDKKINSFIKFCLKKKLFNDTFYDYGNIFSVVATNLPETFATISNGDEIVKRDKFSISFIKKYKFTGDIDYIYDSIDHEKKGYITWENFKEFFLPYIKNISM